MKSMFRALLMGCVAFACSGERAFEGEVGGSLQQAFGIAQCASSSAVHTTASRFNYSAAGGYGTACNANDVTSMDSANRNNVAFITSALPTNEADCLATFIQADLYDWSGSSWVHVSEIVERGAWKGGLGWGGMGTGGLGPGNGTCSVAKAAFGRLTPRAKYRIAATARTYQGSSFTTLPFAVVTWLLQ